MEKRIAQMFRNYGYSLAKFDSLTGCWIAQSRFGYALGYYPKRSEARKAVVTYYVERPYLVLEQSL
jgi:hypothetical protein